MLVGVGVCVGVAVGVFVAVGVGVGVQPIPFASGTFEQDPSVVIAENDRSASAVLPVMVILIAPVLLMLAGSKELVCLNSEKGNVIGMPSGRG